MGRIAIAYGNLTDTSTLSGGTAAAGHPLTEMQDRELAKYWESATADAANTKFTMDHGSAKAARFFGCFAWSAAADATLAIKRGTTSGGSEVQSIAAAAVRVFTPLDSTSFGSYFGIFAIAPAEASARYTTFEFASSAVVRVGRPFVGPMFVPPYNPDKGDMNEDWLPSNSTVDRTESGADWAHERTELRGKALTMRGLSAAQLSLLHEITRTHKTTGEIVYIPDINNAARTQQFGFLGIQRQLSRLERIGLDLGSFPLTLDERGGAP